MSERAPVLVVPNGFEANFVTGFVRGLGESGTEVFVLSCDETAATFDAVGIPHRNVRGSLDEERSFLAKTWNLVRYYLLTLRAVFQCRGSVVHFCGLFRNSRILIEGGALNLWMRLWAGRYIYTVHNVLPHSREGSAFFRWFYGWIYRIPDVLLVHTKRARQQLIDEFSVPPGRIRLSSLGLNEEMPITDLSRAEARKRIGLKTESKVILFFGKMDEYKGLDLLLESFEFLELKELRLIVAGSFRSDAYREKIMRQLEESKRREAIIFEERYVSNEEAEVFFKAADVLCLPYRNIYQSGLVFLGPRFGLPMVTTDVGELREFVEGDELGVVTRSNDATGLQLALEEFFRRQEEFPREVITARVQKYRWDRICAEFVDLYDLDRDCRQKQQTPVGRIPVDD